MKRVICKSGIKGWQMRIRKAYASCEEFISYATTYGLHTRLGFETPEAAWEANPLIQGSVIPADYCTITP